MSHTALFDRGLSLNSLVKMSSFCLIIYEKCVTMLPF